MKLITEYWDGVKDKSSPTENMKDTWLIFPIELTQGWSDRIEDLDSKMSVCWLNKADEPRR